MPFVAGVYLFQYGTDWWITKPNTYCVNDTSAPDYGKCYNVFIGNNVFIGKAVFVQTDTATYPKLPCEYDDTCIRYAYTAVSRSFGTVFDYANKQAVVQYVWARSHSWSSQFVENVQYIHYGMIFPTPGYDLDRSWLFPSPNYESNTWPIYDPVLNFKAYLNPYRITSGYVAVLRWQGMFLTPVLYLSVFERGLNNIWYAGDVRIHWAYESSPLAIIPLDHSRDYVPHQELRNAFGYAATGVDQPGWNADDMIRVLKELFPDRAWAVFDDRQHMLYLYNLTPDYVPDWLIEKLTPTAMKVIQPLADATVAKAWLDLLNERNAQIPPQTGLP